MGSHRLARSAYIDHRRAIVAIDGVELPWYLTSDGPQVEKHPDLPIVVLTLPVFVDGVVSIKTADTAIVDPEFGPVGKFARELVRQGFLDAYTDILLPPSIDAED